MLSPQVHGAFAASHVSPEVTALWQLQRDDVNLVSWHRRLPPGLGAELQDWPKRSPAQFDEVVSLAHYDLSGATRGLPGPVGAWLMMDIAMLLARLALVGQSSHLRVCFGVLRSDECRKFHVDQVRYRLVTTYLGPGTEWVPDHAVAREAFSHPVDCPCDANKGIVRDPSTIRHALAGEVIVMKGARHPSRLGAVHRSPPIQGTGRVRVVLSASTVDGS